MQPLFPWLSDYYATLTRMYQQAFRHHALLFKTEPGLGTESLITQYAAFLLCKTPKNKNGVWYACRECADCKLMQAGSHPDFYWLQRVQNKEIGIDKIRDLSEQLNQYARQQGNKVVYIQDAEYLTEAAANALLKTLEEPRPNTYFLLQTNMQTPLMPTIYSRCQPFEIFAPQSSEALSWLKGELKVANDELETALRLTHNRPLQAKFLIEKNLLTKRTEFLRQFWLFYTRKDLTILLPLFEESILGLQLDWITSFFMDALKAHLSIQTGWVNTDLKAGVEQFSKKNTAQNLMQAVSIIEKVRCDLQKINAVNQELMLANGLSKLITEVFEV